jgi:pilus assembly protein Flp/PilA
VKDMIKTFIDDEGGLTIVEYAVAGGLIAAAVVVAFGLLGDAVATEIEDITAALEAP